MKNKIYLVILLFLGRTYGQNGEHYEKTSNSASIGIFPEQIKLENERQQQRSPSLNELFDITDTNYRRKRTINEIIAENPDDLYEIFLREPLPSSVNLESTPPWAMQILAILMKLREKCSEIQSTRKPRPGRRSLSDDDYEYERSRPPLSPRRGKKSFFKPRLGRSGGGIASSSDE